MSPILRSRRTSPRLIAANALGSNCISKYIPIDFRRAPTIRKPKKSIPIRKPTKSIPEPIPLNIAQPIPHAIPQSELLPSIFTLSTITPILPSEPILPIIFPSIPTIPIIPAPIIPTIPLPPLPPTNSFQQSPLTII